MQKYLFFRTDRIGDFLTSLILIKSIKRNNPKAFITVIASKKNYEFIKTIPYINDVKLYPQNLKEKILLLINLRKNFYDAIGVLDGKKRSIYISILLKANYKFLLTTKSIFEKLFNFFFLTILNFNKTSSKIDETKIILNKLKIDFSDTDLNLFDYEIKSSKNLEFVKNFIVLHLDEKWIVDQYSSNQSKIEPNLEQLNDFLINLINKTKKKIVITTGFGESKLINETLFKYKKLKDDLFVNENNNIFLYKKISFIKLKHIIKNSDLIITCHGAASHVAASYNIPIIDIIEFSLENFYNKWTKHFRLYKYVFRENFTKLSSNILYML